MNSLEAQLDYPFGETLPETGQTLQLAPGLHWLRMPLPFALNHINLWLLEDGGQSGADQPGDGQPGYCIIDCGIANDATRAAWQQIFASHAPIKRVLATHCHPDHVGNADWLCQQWQVPLWMSGGEYAFARIMSAGLPGADGVAALPHFQRHGLLDPALLEQMQSRKNYYPSLVPAVPLAYTRLCDGQLITIGRYQWRVITGFGHSPEHVALYCAALGVLISGDMVLPRISTNVSVFAIEPDGDPLQQYLASLDKFADLPSDTLVLPSHGKPFRGLATRIDQLREHHVARLNEVMQACHEPQSAADIVPVLFPRALDAHQRSFAMGEALAHLHLLWHEKKLCRTIGSDGVIRYQKL
jgi:glyoxylase-like metal-dependent hydrolase (beta-lactamase superfamily II)